MSHSPIRRTPRPRIAIAVMVMLAASACGSADTVTAGDETIDAVSDASVETLPMRDAEPVEEYEPAPAVPDEPLPADGETESYTEPDSESSIDSSSDEPIEEDPVEEEPVESDLDEPTPAEEEPLFDAPEPEIPLTGDESGIRMDSLRGWGLSIQPGIADECIDEKANELGRTPAGLRDSAGFGVVLFECVPLRFAEALEWTTFHLTTSAGISDEHAGCAQNQVFDFYSETPFAEAEALLEAIDTPPPLTERLLRCGMSEADVDYLLNAV